MLFPSRWHFTSQCFDKSQVAVDKCEGKTTSAFVPDFDSALCDNSSIGCLDETDDNSPKQSYIMGGALFIMAFESLQSALSSPTWQLVYEEKQWARKAQQAGFKSLRCLHHDASEETTLANVGILSRRKPTPAEVPPFKVSLPTGLKSRACTNTRALTAWVLFLMHKRLGSVVSM